MFWKAVILAVGAILVSRWQIAKANHRAKGLPLRLDARTGAYVAYCPFGTAERMARKALWIVAPLFLAYMAVAVWAVLTI